MSVKSRVKISAAYSDFDRELQKLISFNLLNISHRVAGRLSQSQIDLLVESVFFNSYRHYENFVREAFLLCCIGKVIKRPKVVSYLNAKNFEHSEQLIKSTSAFLDWTHPDKLVNRAELFLENGHPFKVIITSHRVALLAYKRLRNHIAHDSLESTSEYEKILINYYGTLPLTMPSVGQHLLQPSRTNVALTQIDVFFSTIKIIAFELAR